MHIDYVKKSKVESPFNSKIENYLVTKKFLVVEQSGVTPVMPEH